MDRIQDSLTILYVLTEIESSHSQHGRCGDVERALQLPPARNTAVLLHRALVLCLNLEILILPMGADLAVWYPHDLLASGTVVRAESSMGGTDIQLLN